MLRIITYYQPKSPFHSGKKKYFCGCLSATGTICTLGVVFAPSQTERDWEMFGNFLTLLLHTTLTCSCYTQSRISVFEFFPSFNPFLDHFPHKLQQLRASLWKFPLHFSSFRLPGSPLSGFPQPCYGCEYFLCRVEMNVVESTPWLLRRFFSWSRDPWISPLSTGTG